MNKLIPVFVVAVILFKRIALTKSWPKWADRLFGAGMLLLLLPYLLINHPADMSLNAIYANAAVIVGFFLLSCWKSYKVYLAEKRVM